MMSELVAVFRASKMLSVFLRSSGVSIFSSSYSSIILPSEVFIVSIAPDFKNRSYSSEVRLIVSSNESGQEPVSNKCMAFEVSGTQIIFMFFVGALDLLYLLFLPVFQVWL